MKNSKRFILAAVIGLAFGCKREERQFQVNPAEAGFSKTITLSTLKPGGGGSPDPVNNKYEESAYAVSEGKRLFSQMNCVGCHAHGGGGMGVPLMDDKWVYGSRPEQIFATIIEGRPNGMPSFRGKIPDYQVWQLAAYVRSLGGLLSQNVDPGRDDDIHPGPPENSQQKNQPKASSFPKSAERP